MTDPVLPVIMQVEIDLEAFALPTPLRSNITAGNVFPYAKPPANATAVTSDLTAWFSGSAAAQPPLSCISLLLSLLYKIPFLAPAGHELGGVIGGIPADNNSNTLASFLRQAGDILGTLSTPIAPSTIPPSDCAQELATVLDSLAKLPGSTSVLGTASAIITDIVSLMNDIPTARAELYMIAQQLDAIAGAFNVAPHA